MSDDKRHEQEFQLQQRADHEPRLPGDNADDYRFLHHAVRAAPMPEMPEGFAAHMESITQDVEEQVAFETWLLRVLLAIGAAGGVVACGFGISIAMEMLSARIPNTSMTLLLVAGCGIAGTWMADRWLDARKT